MDFSLVLKYLVKLFNEEKIPYALIGGLALDIHGIIRTTKDIDILIPVEELDKVGAFLLEHGYKQLFKTTDVASYISDNIILGRVDLILAQRKYTKEMLRNTISFKTKISQNNVNVVNLNDLIGLKIQAYFGRKERKAIDLEDIKSIIRKYKGKLNYSKIKEYFSLFGAEDLLKEIWEWK